MITHNVICCLHSGTNALFIVDKLCEAALHVVTLRKRYDIWGGIFELNGYETETDGWQMGIREETVP